MCSSSSKAIYEGKEISGLVKEKEKEKAKREYQEHKAGGSVAGYSINQRIFLRHLENPAREHKSSSNKLWKRPDYSIVRPRYSPAEDYRRNKLSSLKNLKFNGN